MYLHLAAVNNAGGIASSAGFVDQRQDGFFLTLRRCRIQFQLFLSAQDGDPATD
jgi:hypothetical protein